MTSGKGRFEWEEIISTHTLTWSVTRLGIQTERHSRNFNSHAHVERDDGRTIQAGQIFISTHTLTWSVTRVLGGLKVDVVISTHTLTWSVTLRNAKVLI